MIFQSTHPARGATRGHPHHRPVPDHFNPRTPRGVRRADTRVASRDKRISIHAPREGCDGVGGLPFGLVDISIHAPREGCDWCRWTSLWSCGYFNPRTPRGVRPTFRWRDGPPGNFNPRTPRGVRLFRFPHIVSAIAHFNPRTPRGVRPTPSQHPAAQRGFQSTHPARGATSQLVLRTVQCAFQSTHPARGATSPEGI